MSANISGKVEGLRQAPVWGRGLVPSSADLSLGAIYECTTLSFSEILEGKRLKGVHDRMVEKAPAKPGTKCGF